MTPGLIVEDHAAWRAGTAEPRTDLVATVSAQVRLAQTGGVAPDSADVDAVVAKRAPNSERPVGHIDDIGLHGRMPARLK